MNTMLSAAQRDDAELVTASLAGDRDAFGQIVSRYQALVCALAYSATGSLAQSEDTAQETFITAWQHLGQLRETSKLRAWLCGITRNLINRHLGRQGREPTHAAEPLDAAHESLAPEAPPSEQAISREEQAILWRSLQHIPEIYREPLILFYREHQSIERVAAALELSDDAVKQRLSRGRKLLQEQVAPFVAGALQQTAPGDAFTLSVMGALPALAIPAATTAMAAGVTAAKSGVAAKAAASATFAVAILNPVLLILSSLIGYKVSLENAASSRERQFLTRLAWSVIALAGLQSVGLFLFVYLLFSESSVPPALSTASIIVEEIVSSAALLALILRAKRTLRRIRLEEAARLAPGIAPPAKPWYFRSFEYRSRWMLFGLPLVHIRQRCTKGGKMQPAIGWIAVGDLAVGVLFAFSGVAVGAVSIGFCAVGVLAFGGFALGVVSCASTAALGWLAASGDPAVAHDFAVGATAYAQHANDEAAQAFLQNNGFFRCGTLLLSNVSVLWWLTALIVWQLSSLRRTRHPPGATESK